MPELRDYEVALQTNLICDRELCDKETSLRAVFVPSFEPEWIVWIGPEKDKFGVCSAVAQSSIWEWIQSGSSSLMRSTLKCADLKESVYLTVRRAWVQTLLRMRHPPEHDPRKPMMMTTDGESFRFLAWGYGIGPLEGIARNPPARTEAGRLAALARLLQKKTTAPLDVSERDLTSLAESVVGTAPR